VDRRQTGQQYSLFCKSLSAESGSKSKGRRLSADPRTTSRSRNHVGVTKVFPIVTWHLDPLATL
jgi:hypothetical protein